MRLLLIVLLQTLSTSPAADPWLLVPVDTADAFMLIVHDSETGLFVQYQSGVGAADPASLPERLRTSGRVLSSSHGEDRGYRWERFELDDPGADFAALVKDIGQEPPPGSWLHASLEAHSPPPACPRRIEYVVTHPSGRAFSLKATPCSVEQRVRLDDYLSQIVHGARSEVWIDEEHGYDPAPPLSESDLKSMEPGISAIDVASRFGRPQNMWPSAPEGFTWIYPMEASMGHSVALSFDRSRSLVKVRALSEIIWE